MSNAAGQGVPDPAAAGPQKKRHHYVPVTYLSRFADAGGRLYAYRKDNPVPALHIRPSEIAFERYYYSQPTPEGGQDNNRLEDLFSDVETVWPSLVDDLTAGRDISDRLEALFHFIGLLRVRGPAARDPVELHLAHLARQTMHRLMASGDIAQPPAGLTLDDIEISIDPHQSIHAMVSMLQGFSHLCNFFGFEVVQNATTEPFATSDAPVVILDPDVPEAHLLPYTVRPPQGRIEVLLPISPRVLLRGRSELLPNRPGVPFPQATMTSGAAVRRVNRLVARFGYRFVFADHPNLGNLVTKHAALSPTIRFDDLPAGEGGTFQFSQMVFGPRPLKPKWRAGD